MKVTVTKSFCGIETGTPLDLPKHLADPLLKQGLISEVSVEDEPEKEPDKELKAEEEQKDTQSESEDNPEVKKEPKSK